MKLKYVLLFVLISVSFCFIDNVSALTSSYTSEEYESGIDFLYNGTPTSSYGDSTKNYILNTLIGNKLYETYGDYYFCHIHNGARGGSCYITDYPEQIYFKSDYNIIVKYDASKPVYFYYVSNGSVSSDNSYITEDQTINRQHFNQYNYERTNIESFILKTEDGTDLKFTDGYVVENNTVFNSYDNELNRLTLFIQEQLPTIEITKESEEITTIDNVDYITAVNMKIETNVIDDTKYICMLSTDMQDWDKYICSETYNYRMEKNGTLYVKIVDKVSEELITSATYTVSSIQSLPYKGDKVNIYFQKITEKVDPTLYNQCTISQSLVNYRVCETVSISFDVINYNKYIYEMSLDGGNTWEDVSTRIYNNFYLERIFENKVIYIRVLNRSDYSYNNSSTYQITTIESASEYGQKVLFGSKYYTQRPDVDVTALFLNYDSTTYNYYYSLYNTSDSFIDITDSISCTNNLCTFNTRIYVKGTMYVRIEDKAGNLIYTATYTVDYYNWMNSNNPFDKDDFFSTFFDSFDYFLNPIKEIFNSITLFFDSLPIEIKYTFYVSFVIIIILFLIKFIL